VEITSLFIKDKETY